MPDGGRYPQISDDDLLVDCVTPRSNFNQEESKTQQQKREELESRIQARIQEIRNNRITRVQKPFTIVTRHPSQPLPTTSVKDMVDTPNLKCKIRCPLLW